MRLLTWGLMVIGLLSLLGLYFGLAGMLMTGSFAVAGPAATSAAREAYWHRIQHYYDAVALVSLRLLVAAIATLLRRYVGRAGPQGVGNPGKPRRGPEAGRHR